MKSNLSDLLIGAGMSIIAILAYAKGIYFLSIFCGGIVLSVLLFKTILLFNKKQNYNYQKLRLLFFLTGVAIITATLTSAFNYEFVVEKVLPPPPEIIDIGAEEIPPITIQKEKEIKKEVPPVKTEKVNVVKNNIELIDKKNLLKDIQEDPPIIKTTTKKVKALIDKVKNEEPVIIYEPEVDESPIIYDFPQVQAEFVGGVQEMLKFILNNVKYPTIAKENNIQGRVYVQFIVETDGSISNIEVIRGIGGGCDQEAIRVVKSMPKWKPATQNGKAVKMRFKLPITFKLQ